MISKRLLKLADDNVLAAIQTAHQVMNEEVAVRPRDQRLGGAILVLVAHLENQLMRVEQLETERINDQEFILELRAKLPADLDRQGRDYMKERA